MDKPVRASEILPAADTYALKAIFNKVLLLKTALFILLFSVTLLCTGQTITAKIPVLILNDPNDAPFTRADGSGFLDLVVGEAFRRAHIKLHLVKLPAERALLNANAGIEDGDLSRIVGLESQYPNLIRVPEKLVNWEFVAFSMDRTISAKLGPLRAHSVAYIKGWKIYEQMMAGAPAVATAEDSAQLFRLLELKRVEAVLYVRWMGLNKIHEQGLQGIVVLEPPLATREMYIYLHKKHIKLVPKIAAALREIKKEGLYDRLYREKILQSVEPRKR